jgi:O-antigen ligase
MIVNNTKISKKTYLLEPFKAENIILVIMLLCVAMTGIIPQNLQALLCVLLLFLLFISDNLVLVYPIMLFYYSYLGLIAGISVYRIFSILVLVRALISFSKNEDKENSELKHKMSALIPVVIIYLLYSIVVIVPYSVRIALFSFVDVLCVIVLVKKIISSTCIIKKVFTIYVITAIIAFFSGMIIGNTMTGLQVIDGELVRINRFMATFNDPNYLGMFYSIAIFALLSLKLFSKRMRIIIVIAFYVVLAMSISMTAIIGNIVFWMAYLFITKKINMKTFSILVVLFIMMIGLYQYGLMKTNTPVIGDLVSRIEDKLTNIKSNDIDSFTSQRTALTKSHLNYYKTQSTYTMLFGGYKVNSYIVEIPGMAPLVAHNEYVDLLLNVGLIGTIFLIGFAVFRFINSFILYRKNMSEAALCVCMIKIIWLFYAATLTMFLDFRFMLCFFI